MPAVETQGVTPGPVRTMIAAAANQGRGRALVQGGSDTTAAVCAAANAKTIGFQAEDSVNAGDPILVNRQGECVAIAGAAVAAGAFLITDNQGRLVASAAIGDEVCAEAVTSASNAGDYLVVFCNRFIR